MPGKLSELVESVAGLQLLNDPQFPCFRLMDPRIREGGDNPEQRYLFAKNEAGVDYLVFGKLGNATRIEVQ